MFPASLMDVQPSILPDVDAHFKDVYDIHDNPYLSAVNKMVTVVPMDKRQKRYAYSLTVPLIVRWDRGETIPESGNTQESFVLNVFRWGIKISWDVDDRMDQEIGTIMEDTSRLAESAKSLRVRVFFQMLEGVADEFLVDLALLDPCPDGVSLFSATDGSGADRYGVEDGNIVEGTGVTEAAITDDIWTVINRYRSEKHTDGKTPYHNPEKLHKITFIIPTALEKMFERVLTRTRQSDGTATGGLTNLIKETGFTPELVVSPYLIAVDDWYAVVESPNYGIVVGERQALQTKLFDTEQSVEHFDSNTESFRVKLREGYAYGPAQAYIKVVQTT